MVLYFVYTFFEMSTIATVFYFDDLLTVNTTTFFRSFGVCTVVLFLLTFYFTVPNLLTFIISLLVGGLLSISLLFGFILINDVLVSDILDLFAELSLSLTGFFYYCMSYIILNVVMTAIFSYNAPGFLGVMSWILLIISTAGFLPALGLLGGIFLFWSLGACYKFHIGGGFLGNYES